MTEMKRAWRRFRQNRPAFAGLWVIVASVLVALFAYALAPDHTPNANTHTPELALLPAGSRVEQLALALNRPSVPWYTGWWSGRPSGVKLVPVDPGTVLLRGDSVNYTWQGKAGSAHLLQIFHPYQDSVQRQGDTYRYRDPAGVWQQVERAALENAWAAGDGIRQQYFLLGADKYGRCIFSRLLIGFRVSLVVGLIAVFISLSVGVFVGLLGGYFGGRLDDLVMLLVNTVWSIPTLLLVFAIVLALGRGIGIIFLAVGLTMWVDVARLVRGQTIALRELPFVEAAKSMGLGHFRILFRHILPNLVGPILVVAAGNFATAILVESGLSYLGFGVQPPMPSWGAMLNENYGYALNGKPLLALAPAMAIALTVLAFNLVGNGLRDAYG